MVQFITVTHQIVMVLLALLVLILWSRKLWMENQIASRKLKELDRDG